MNEKYHCRSDEEIIYMIHNSDEGSMEYLLEKYKNLICQKARKLYLIGGDKDDLIQEGMIGLYKAIRDFQADRNGSFYNFADLCVSRQMYSAIKASNRKKNMPLNTYISLDAPVYEEEAGQKEHVVLAEITAQNNFLNPEQLFIDKENTSVIEYELGRCLSTMENKVLSLYMEGLTYVQIADKLDKSPKSIDNALQRIKAKLNHVLEALR